MRAVTSAISISAAPSSALPRQYHAMVGAGEDAHDVRHHDADKADDARNGNGSADRCGGRDHDRALRPLHVDPEMEGFRLAEQEPVQGPHQPRRDQRHERRKGSTAMTFGQLAPPRLPMRPQRQVAQLAVVAGKRNEPVSAPANAAIAMPASSSVPVMICPRRPATAPAARW